MNSKPLKVTLREWETSEPTEQNGLAAITLPRDRLLASVVQALNQKSMLGITELRTGLRLQAYSFVGRVQLGPVEVTIHPKIQYSTILALLRYAYGFRHLERFSSTQQELSPDGFLDLLVHQLHVEINELRRRGVHRSYVSRQESLVSPRGRIGVQEIARQGGVITDSLPCRHHPRLEDTLLNQVLLAGLRLSGRVASNLQLRRTSKRLASVFAESVSLLSLNRSTLRQAQRQVNRLTRAYEPAFTLIQLLMDAEGPMLTEGGATVPLPGFLFDMNRFWQALLSRLLREHLTDFAVQDEFRLRGILQYQSEYNPRRRLTPQLRPDFVLMQDGRIRSILDAKYRDLWERPLPREMLYQLALYALSYRQRVATILFPTTSAEAKESRIELRDPVFDRRTAEVRLRPVVVPQLAELILKRHSPEILRQRRDYARWLAFG